MLHRAGIATDLLAADKAIWPTAFEGDPSGSESAPVLVLLDDGADVINEFLEFLGHGVVLG